MLDWWSGPSKTVLKRWPTRVVALSEGTSLYQVTAFLSPKESQMQNLEIENPGLLPFGLTVDDVPFGVSTLRNRVIGRVFHALGLIEQWGSGIQRMMAACRDAGLANPRFEDNGVLREVGTGPQDPERRYFLASLRF